MISIASTTAPTLTISVCRDQDVALVALGGRLDAETVEVVVAELEALLADGARELLVDLAGTVFLDDDAARALVEAARSTRALGGTLHVFHVDGQPRALLQGLALCVDGPLLSVPQAA